MQAPRPGLQRVLRLLALIGLLGQLLTGLVSAQTPAGDWTCRTNWNCTANDVNATNFRLRDYSDGPLAACTPGEPVSAYIWADVTNGTSAARTAPRVSADYALSTAPGELFQLESCVLHQFSSMRMLRSPRG